jgi:hypothetical protein
MNNILYRFKLNTTNALPTSAAKSNIAFGIIKQKVLPVHASAF